jgi:hypothetical protein
MTDAGIPIAAVSALMPMPSHAFGIFTHWDFPNFS